MTRVHFVFVGEGTSDDCLIPHLENLCLELGADEARGTRIDYDRTGGRTGCAVIDKLRAASRIEPNADLYFVHRDTDNQHHESRYTEIETAIEILGCRTRWVAVIPVRETESWLLLDESAIRNVFARPDGKEPLELPAAGQVERRANPKEILQQALVRASGKTGRKLDKVKAEFSDHRRHLLMNLPTGGKLERLPSWCRMRDDLKRAIDQLCQVPRI